MKQTKGMADMYSFTYTTNKQTNPNTNRYTHMHPRSVLPSGLKSSILSRGWLSDSLLQVTSYLALCIANTHTNTESISLVHLQTHTHTQAEQLCTECFHGWGCRVRRWLIPVRTGSLSVTLKNDLALWRRISHILPDMDNLNTHYVYTAMWEKKNTSVNALTIAQCPVESLWDRMLQPDGIPVYL